MGLGGHIMHRKPWLPSTERNPILEEIFVLKNIPEGRFDD